MYILTLVTLGGNGFDTGKLLLSSECNDLCFCNVIWFNAIHIAFNNKKKNFQTKIFQNLKFIGPKISEPRRFNCFCCSCSSTTSTHGHQTKVINFITIKALLLSKLYSLRHALVMVVNYYRYLGLITSGVTLLSLHTHLHHHPQYFKGSSPPEWLFCGTAGTGGTRQIRGQTVRDRFGPNSLFFNAMMTILGYLHGTTAINPIIQ